MVKNILFISPTGTLDNGAEISIFHLMTHLVQEGHKVYNIVPQYHHPSQTSYYDRSRAEGIEVDFIPSLKWWWEDAPGGQPASSQAIQVSHLENIQYIRGVIRDRQIDLVITNTVNMPQGALAAACEDTPHYWLIHEFPDNEFAYYRDKIDFIIAHSDKIFSVTGGLQENLVPLFAPQPVETFISYTELTASQLGKGSTRRLVSVGRLTERKNQLELLQAFAKLNRPDLDLVFVGGWDDEYKAKCDRYISEQGLTNVKFLGHQDQPWAPLTDQDICILPSAMETFGLVYVEAMMKGLPIILSDNPGHLSAHAIFKGGHLYPSGDQASLVNRIEEVLADFARFKAEALTLQEEVASNYTVENSYQDILKGIETIVFRKKVTRHLGPLLASSKPDVNKGIDKQKFILAKIKEVLKRKLKL